MEIVTYEIPQKVMVRKYPVDCEKLCKVLREHKEKAQLSNKTIAEVLNTTLTKVEHWFRQDNSFAIPDRELWFEIKKLLNIETEEFDICICEFQEKDNVFEKGNRIYDSIGISPTITCADDIAILLRREEVEVKVIGQMDNTIDHTFESANRVYDTNGIAPTINTCGGGGLQPKIIDDTYVNREPRVYEDFAPSLRSEREGFKTIVAMRGRNPENPSDRTVGAPTEQRLEPNSQGICNTLTSVTKDNLVMETVRIKQATSQGYIECELGGVADLSFPDSKTRRGRVQENGQVSPALMAGEQDICRIQKVGQISNDGSQYGTVISENGISANLVAGTHGYANNCIQTKYRIRKLTPLECWRLMDFKDEDFHKAAEVNSNTQLYKQAGNSIVRNVLVAIMGQMIHGKENIYKEI